MDRVMINRRIRTKDLNGHQQPGETSRRDFPKGDFLQTPVQKVKHNPWPGYLRLLDFPHDPARGEAG